VLVPFQFTLAFWLFAASLVCDGLDGVVARQVKKNTAAGSYTDLFCDQTVVAFCTVGMVWRGDIYPALAVLFVFTDTALSIQLVLHHLLQVSSRWIVRPGKTLFSIAIGLDFFFHINLLNYLLLAYLLTLLLLVISFRRLRKAL